MNNPNLNGPESIPLRDYVKSLPLTVQVYDGTNCIRTENIDYSNAEHRKWIGKVTVWAAANKYEVRTKANPG